MMSFDYRPMTAKEKAEDSLGVTMERCDRPSHGSFPLSQTQGMGPTISAEGTHGTYWHVTPQEVSELQPGSYVWPTLEHATNWMRNRSAIAGEDLKLYEVQGEAEPDPNAPAPEAYRLTTPGRVQRIARSPDGTDKQESLGSYWHVSPQSNHEAINQRGLEPRETGSPMNPKGVYLFDNLEQAQDYRDNEVPYYSQEPHHIYEVKAGQVQDDPEDAMADEEGTNLTGRYFTTEAIPPERVRRVSSTPDKIFRMGNVQDWMARGEVKPYAEHDPATQKAIAHYMSVDGEAWPYHGDVNESLHQYVAEHGDQPFGITQVPTEELKAAVMQSPDIVKEHGPDWDAYHAWYRQGDWHTYGGPPEGYTEHWPVILDDQHGEPLQDGWHRFHQYVEDGVDPIPAVYYPRQHTSHIAPVTAQSAEQLDSQPGDEPEHSWESADPDYDQQGDVGSRIVVDSINGDADGEGQDNPNNPKQEEEVVASLPLPSGFSSEQFVHEPHSSVLDSFEESDEERNNHYDEDARAERHDHKGDSIHKNKTIVESQSDDSQDNDYAEEKGEGQHHKDFFISKNAFQLSHESPLPPNADKFFAEVDNHSQDQSSHENAHKSEYPNREDDGLLSNHSHNGAEDQHKESKQRGADDYEVTPVVVRDSEKLAHPNIASEIQAKSAQGNQGDLPEAKGEQDWNDHLGSPIVDELDNHATKQPNQTYENQATDIYGQRKSKDVHILNDQTRDPADNHRDKETKGRAQEREVRAFSLPGVRSFVPLDQFDVLGQPGPSTKAQHQSSDNDQSHLPEAQREEDWNDHEPETISSQMSRQGAMTRTKKLELAAQLEQEYGPDASTVEHEFPDGYTIRRLQQYGDLNREGDLMSNCWSRNYWLDPKCGYNYRSFMDSYKDHTTPGMSRADVVPGAPQDNASLINPKPDYNAPLHGYGRRGATKYMSLRDPDNLPVISYFEGASGRPNSLLARHNTTPQPEDHQRVMSYYEGLGERQGAVNHHYHPTTGKPCSCYYGSIKHRTASQQIRKLRNENRRYLRDEEGQKFLGALEKLLGEHPGLESLVPWFADRYKHQQMWVGPDRGRARVNPDITDPGVIHQMRSNPSNVYPDMGDWQTNPEQKEQVQRYLGTPFTHMAGPTSDWWNARNHPLRQGVQPIGMDTWDIRRVVGAHRQAVAEAQRKKKLIEDGIADDGTEMHRWPDGSHVKELNDGEELDREGEAMNHCTHSDEQPYKRAVDDGVIRMFSLRDKDGWPHATWHYNPDQSLAHVQGRSGMPKDAYRNKITEFNDLKGFSDGPVVGDNFGHMYDEDLAYGDAEIYLPRPDSVDTYTQQYHDDGDRYEMAHQYGNYGEETDVIPGEPEWESIAEDYIDSYGSLPPRVPQRDVLQDGEVNTDSAHPFNPQTHNMRERERDRFHDALDSGMHHDEMRDALHGYYQTYKDDPDYVPQMNKAITNFENWYNSPSKWQRRNPQPQVMEYDEQGNPTTQYTHPKLFVPNRPSGPGGPRLGPDVEPNSEDTGWVYAKSLEGVGDRFVEENGGSDGTHNSAEKSDDGQAGIASKGVVYGGGDFDKKTGSKEDSWTPIRLAQEVGESRNGPGHEPLEVSKGDWSHNGQGDEDSWEGSQREGHWHRLAAGEPISDEYVRECLREAGVQGGPLVHEWAKNLLTMIHSDYTSEELHGEDPSELAHEAADQALSIGNTEAMQMFAELPELHNEQPELGSGEERTPFQLVQLHLYDVANNLAHQELERMKPEQDLHDVVERHNNQEMQPQQQPGPFGNGPLVCPHCQLAKLWLDETTGDWRCQNCDSAWADTGQGPDFETQSDKYTVETDVGKRVWDADDAEHAAEQHQDAFPEEEILDIHGPQRQAPQQQPQPDAGTEPCPSCEGTGKSVYAQGQPCPICDGTGKLGPHLT